MPKFFIFLLTILATYVNVLASSPKWNVCTVTINSDDEKKSFQHHLSKGKNKGKFKFTELTDYGAGRDQNKDQWFDRACKSGVKCDILLISGHFGGSYFGETGFSLGMETLDKYSCNNKCPGILSNPTEVFLFGCNTLASKDKDNRTYDEYLRALLSDGLSNQRAEQIANARYSPIGDSFKDANKRIFSNVPHIYGFHSKGPLGRNIRHMVDSYFKEIPDYSNYLATENLKLAQVYNNHFLTGKSIPNDQEQILGNKKLDKALKLTHFAQVSQTPIRCGDEFVAGEDNVKDYICGLKDKTKSQVDKLELAFEVLNSPHVNGLIPNISKFVEGIEKFTDEDLKLIDKHKNNTALRTELKSLIESLSSYSPRYAIQLSNSMEKIELLDSKDQFKILDQAMGNIFKQPIYSADKQYLCSLSEQKKNYIGKKLRLENISPDILSTYSGVSTILCLNPEDKSFDSIKKKIFTGEIDVYRVDRIVQDFNIPEIAKNVGYSDILEIIKNTRDKKSRKAALIFMQELKSTKASDQDILLNVASNKSESYEIRSSALRALSVKMNEPQKERILNIIRSDDDIKIKNRGIRALIHPENTKNLTSEDLVVVAQVLKNTTGNLQKEPYKSVLVNSAITLLKSKGPLSREVKSILKERKLKSGDNDAGFAYFFNGL